MTRVLFYSHDSFGLGHLRRCSILAAAITAENPNASVLIVTGSPCATHFDVSPGIDIVKIPTATKVGRERYVSRSLGGEYWRLMSIRRKLMQETLRSFDPDVVVVDNRPLGLDGELEGFLEMARFGGACTVLGLRDIIDSPERVAKEWESAGIQRALVSGYDRICVYGCPELYDLREQLGFAPDVLQKVEYVGYVTRQEPDVPVAPDRDEHQKPEVLVTVGGGEDGGDCIDAFLACLEAGSASFDSRIVLGPLFDSPHVRALKRRCASLAGVTVHRFHHDVPRLLQQASAVVAMAGYNTVTEILASRTPAVLVPRTSPRAEQLIRARRLAEFGFAECLVDPTAEALSAAIERALAKGLIDGWLPPLDGATRFATFIENLARSDGEVSPQHIAQSS